jgi:hypothetical protein
MTALRSTLALALYGHALFLLAAMGQLRALPIVLVTVAALVALIVIPSVSEGPGREGGTRNGLRATRSPRSLALARDDIAMAVPFLPLLLLALYPPLAFDETLYHLPFVRAFARDGALRFLPDLRFPVFPQFHELLCVPPFLVGGDVAPHLVALLEVMLIVALLLEWDRRAGWLAAAFFLGSPLVTHIATITYVDAALTLFVAAGFFALDRERYALAGFFFGTACSVKYLGGYFAVFALLLVLVRAADRRRAAGLFILTGAAAALPTTAWIFYKTGSPVFPFFPSNLWTLALDSHAGLADRLIAIIRAPWDVTFARARMNVQPPVTPFLIPAVALLIAAARRNSRARWLLAISAGYLVILSFFPPEARYFVPLLPLVALGAATIVVTRWPKIVPLLGIVVVLPGLAYAGYRLARLGVPPVTSVQREQWLTRHVPEYPALVRTGRERVYVCGAEQLKGLAAGELLGDFAGPYSYSRILGGGGTLAGRLRAIDVRYFLVSKRVCPPAVAQDGLQLAYEDNAAQLWSVQPAPVQPAMMPVPAP